MKIPVRSVGWIRSWRIIPSRYPTANVYYRVVEPKLWASLKKVELKTNPRLRAEQGKIPSFLKPSSHVPGSQYIIAPFAYPNPKGSRFSNGQYGVYYTAHGLMTAIKETMYHREKFMRETNQKPAHIGMRVLLAKMEGKFHDLRGLKNKFKEVYSPESYVASQPLGYQLWKEGSNGIIYNSVRNPGGQCAGVFQPSVLSHCREERFLFYEWDGKRIEKIYEVHEYLNIGN